MKKAAVEVRVASVFGYEADKTPGSLVEPGSPERSGSAALPCEAHVERSSSSGQTGILCRGVSPGYVRKTAGLA